MMLGTNRINYIFKMIKWRRGGKVFEKKTKKKQILLIKTIILFFHN